MLTVIGIGLRTLLRDRVALALTFILPLAFFSVFATAFSAMDAEGLLPARTIVVVDRESAFGARLAQRIATEPGIAAEIAPPERREEALQIVRRGDAAVAVIIPPGLAPRIGPSAGAAPPIELHVDRSNPLAGGLVEGRVQAAAAAATLEALPLPGLDPDALSVPIKIVDALGRTGKRPSIAFFAAGLGVLFLMFAVTGRGAVLIDERETGVLSRILASRVGLLRLLLGRWLFLAGLGTVQVIVMFLWAAAGFGLDLFNPRCLVGFLAVTVITAAAASAFGMVLAAACRTRVQLQGVAVVVILGLCAVGGNLFPSFLMPAGLRDAGRLTFNAWALSAYQKVFWYEQGVAKLLPELTLLILSAGLFFAVAWLIARGWQRTGGLA